jgi:hypothetical protein
MRSRYVDFEGGPSGGLEGPPPCEPFQGASAATEHRQAGAVRSLAAHCLPSSCQHLYTPNTDSAIIPLCYNSCLRGLGLVACWTFDACDGSSMRGATKAYAFYNQYST